MGFLANAKGKLTSLVDEHAGKVPSGTLHGRSDATPSRAVDQQPDQNVASPTKSAADAGAASGTASSADPLSDRLADPPGPTAAELHRARQQSKRLQAELNLLREFTRDPRPELHVPDSVENTISAVLEQRLTYLGETSLRALARLVIDVDDVSRDGLILEAGTALGGSAIVMAAAKDPARQMRVYDAFGLIPPPGAQDPPEVHDRYAVIAAGGSSGLGGDAYYGYREDLLAEVTASFARLGVDATTNNVHLVKGLFQDTVEVDEPVALAHLDGDWYDSTLVCLERIAPHLVPGGRIVLDDFYYWAGCRQAVEDYFKRRVGFTIEHRAKVHVVRD